MDKKTFSSNFAVSSVSCAGLTYLLTGGNAQLAAVGAILSPAIFTAIVLYTERFTSKDS